MQKGAAFSEASFSVGFPLGLVAATIVFSAVAKLPEAEFVSWGWRVPFLVSFLLVGVGLFVETQTGALGNTEVREFASA